MSDKSSFRELSVQGIIVMYYAMNISEIIATVSRYTTGDRVNSFYNTIKMRGNPNDETIFEENHEKYSDLRGTVLSAFLVFVIAILIIKLVGQCFFDIWHDKLECWSITWNMPCRLL